MSKLQSAAAVKPFLWSEVKADYEPSSGDLADSLRSNHLPLAAGENGPDALLDASAIECYDEELDWKFAGTLGLMQLCGYYTQRLYCNSLTDATSHPNDGVQVD